MANLSIKNVPDSVLEKLRDRAARHHRSIQGELMALISAAVEPSEHESESSSMRRSGTRRVEQIAAEHRRRWKKPFNKGPRAVDMIRADRDAR